MKVLIKKVKDLTKKEMSFINTNRLKEFGATVEEWQKDYLIADTFLIKDEEDIVAFGMLMPIKIRYLNKNYNILGISSVISVERKKGYGKKIINSMIDYAKPEKKTLIGFCQKHSKKFYEKCKIKLNKPLLKRFLYKNSINKYEDYVIYHEGKDNLMKKLLSTKLNIRLNGPFW